MLSETGSPDKKELKRSRRKYESEKLRTYIDENPEATIVEIAKVFGGSKSGAFDALEREKIS